MKTKKVNAEWSSTNKDLIQRVIKDAEKRIVVPEIFKNKTKTNKSMEKVSEKLLVELVNSAKKNKKGLIRLKNAAVTCMQYELAAQLRSLEVELFPETKDEKSAKEMAKRLNLLFRMVDLDIPLSTCWKINETLRVYSKMKGKFGLKESSKIVEKTKEIFNAE